MAKRRVEADFPQGLDNLAFLRSITEGEEPDIEQLGGALIPPQVDQSQFPSTPSNPELYRDNVDNIGVDDVPGIPEGIELLGDVAQLESAEDALEQPSSQLMPEAQQEATDDGYGFLRAIGEYFSPEARAENARRNQELFQRNKQGYGLQDQIQENVPLPPERAATEIEEEVLNVQLPPAVEAVVDREPVKPEDITEASIPSEGVEPIPGMVEQAVQFPEYQDVVSRLLGIKRGDLDDSIFAWAVKQQNALTKDFDSLDEEEKQIRQRLQSGNSTMLDKVALGIALATPVIMGLLFGKEAFFSSVAGAAKGFGEAGKQRSDLELKLRDRLATLRKEKGEVEEKYSEIPKKLQEKIRNPALRSIMTDYDILREVRDEMGNVAVVPGKDAELFSDGRFGVKAPGESGEALYYDASLLRDDDDAKNFKSMVTEGSSEYEAAKNSNRLIKNVEEVMSAIESQKPSLFSNLAQYIQPSGDGLLSMAYPDSLKTTTIDLVDSDGKIKTVRALPLLQAYITALQDPYNKEYLGSTRLTEGVIQHWRSIFPDPSAIKTWLTSDFETMKQQGEIFRNLMNQRVSDRLVGKGFLREPLESALRVKETQFLPKDIISQRERQKIIQNPEEARKKVKKG